MRVCFLRFDVMIECGIVLGLLCLLFLFSMKSDRMVSVVCVGVMIEYV